jgi:hypothetical protein
MFGLGTFTCAVCGVRVSGKRVLRGRHRKGVGVCRACYDEWERAGRPCADCHRPVRGAQEIGVCPDRHVFGHADCGGVWVAG